MRFNPYLLCTIALLAGCWLLADFQEEQAYCSQVLAVLPDLVPLSVGCSHPSLGNAQSDLEHSSTLAPPQHKPTCACAAQVPQWSLTMDYTRHSTHSPLI